jgi:hypothetical protein
MRKKEYGMNKTIPNLLSEMTATTSFVAAVS